MSTSQPLHPRRADGSIVDATFELQSVPVYELVFHHKAGGRGSPRAVNSDYHEGLELLLQRLAKIGATVLGVSVDSRLARKLDPAERELDLPFPLPVDPDTDVRAMRLELTRAQKTIARRPRAKAGGGNDQKRIRITLAFDREMSSDEVTRLLVGERSERP